MKGTWTLTRQAPVVVHMYTAPEEGWLVNSHLITGHGHPGIPELYDAAVARHQLRFIFP